MKWRPIDDAPVNTEALLLGTVGMAVGYKTIYGWEPSGVTTNYDESAAIFEIGKLLFYIPTDELKEVPKAE